MPHCVHWNTWLSKIPLFSTNNKKKKKRKMKEEKNKLRNMTSFPFRMYAEMMQLSMKENIY